MLSDLDKQKIDKIRKMVNPIIVIHTETFKNLLNVDELTNLNNNFYEYENLKIPITHSQHIPRKTLIVMEQNKL